MDFRLTAEQQELVQRARAIGQECFAPKAARWDANAEYPYENVEVLRQHGLLGLTIPRRYGGAERPLIDAILVTEEIAKYCGVSARIVVETNMGALGAVMAYGTEEQRQHIARRILEEGDKPAICMTEPQAGTDLGNLKTTAEERGDEYVINGVKCWITGGGVSKTYLVFARVIDRRGEELGIGALLVDRDTPGFTVRRVEDAMGLRGIPEAELVFQDCRVPKENLLLAAPGKEGLKKLMSAYNAQRVGASAVALGLAQGALDHALDYMLEREAFGQKIAAFQGLRWMMAECEIKLQAARTLIYRAACNGRMVANNAIFPDMHEAAVAKAFTARAAFEVVSDCLQMFGARGYSRALPLERMLRDVRMFQIGGGTVQAQLNVIARTLFQQRERQREHRSEGQPA